MWARTFQFVPAEEETNRNIPTRGRHWKCYLPVTGVLAAAAREGVSYIQTGQVCFPLRIDSIVYTDIRNIFEHNLYKYQFKTSTLYISMDRKTGIFKGGTLTFKRDKSVSMDQLVRYFTQTLGMYWCIICLKTSLRQDFLVFFQRP